MEANLYKHAPKWCQWISRFEYWMEPKLDKYGPYFMWYTLALLFLPLYLTLLVAGQIGLRIAKRRQAAEARHRELWQ